jgi:hypothetical protein
MKKILIATNILFLGIIAFQACNSDHPKEAVASTSYCDDSCMVKFCKPYNYDLMPGVLEARIIHHLSDSYAGDNGKGFINGDDNSRDALSVVFNIEKIKTLIYMMQDKACKYGCDPSTELGIRYYFIKYPSDLNPNRTDGLNLPIDNSNKHSLVMVPVYRTNPNGDWYDYDLWVSQKGNCFPAIDTNRMHVAPGGGVLPDGGDNHGGIGPPPGSGIFPSNNN